ncbi:hypothetical protein SERLA73DRAFT_188362 [Serpula lacrymans var. lacrymans S7.3]|uniref:Peptidase A1 domain-containing protein n=2 Tax=Serpula lacrymans var. lacrymans TaxID=341189 RepID=F8QB65_SERL3|nr:uncharacterized protein SERLADRAFT_478439 [Serpula lacrymans var. lacrymans S7.9]EGN94451.1 hypothetical protein SERLA73DRAFT_188362 [Serpula lacrymans var. lacrymans S7.3]EGO19935.1 hypothetical protein SERLADRAFT_478439 [Serpula lacrymans var. lacrymans S7.9]
MVGIYLLSSIITLSTLPAVVSSISIEHGPSSPSLSTGKHTQGVHLPIYRRERTSPRKRSGQTGIAGLGDYLDVSYNVLMQVGDTQTPVVLDTGSSDLWILSSASGANGSSSVPLYDPSTFQPSDLEARLEYGDSLTGTHAFGPIGFDSVSLAGITLSDQYFSAINDTNTTVLQTGSAGIFGLGFPINSVIWGEVFISQQNSSFTSSKRDNLHDTIPTKSHDFEIRFFPKNDLSHFVGSSSSVPQISSRQSSTSPSGTSAIFASYSSIGPFISRLVVQGLLALPMFTVTLQRDAIQIGGNQGMLSLGELPESVNNDSLTWVPVRGYTPEEGGLNPPADAPNEVYPIAWEIPVDDVYFDGERLARSQLSSPNISLSALLDTGNSLIRGPPDVISYILNTALGGSPFPCSEQHTLAFQIGGQMFPVDPRDFVSQTQSESLEDCVANITPTDVPVIGSGYLYSWSLGDPFLKSVLAAFYYGNLGMPSQDPARIGLLSTVPDNAADELASAVSDVIPTTVIAGATSVYNSLPVTSNVAPSRIISALSTGVGGVPLAPTSISGSLSGGKKVNDVREALRVNAWTVGLGVSLWILCRLVG